MSDLALERPENLNRNPRRRRWVFAWAAAGALLLLALGVLLAAIHAGMVHAPLHVSIDGEEVLRGFDARNLPPAHQVLMAALVLFALLAALVLVPLALVFALMAVVGAVLTLIGLPLVLVLLVLALVLSPLILLLWGLWKLLS